MSVTLTNALGRLVTFLLPHESYCVARGACACGVQPGRGGRRLPSSLTLATGVSREDVHEAALSVPAVAAAIRRGELALKRQAPSTPPSSPSLLPASEASARVSRKKRGAS
ncbi:hypothetical protein MXAN_1854 [Myxococcus xanthus DK 1622]|uniref:Uncharacterized protein n=2 Tax=Myxococcus TaxID=32 RepID=Q1DB73_MYXXD|nr:hypothetical protein [Myxococcus xanthus]ABF86279.1 hypothetical protein MXAN_1854 [Myxococcus xanthus DK 1622]NOJ57090.1 hypothetical protein [Myxococcus xanthus]QPM81441.1 hypothetical protein I5Q59_09205 [Myxococcus xanthus]QVW70691.1 hypothetical protein JTM82_14565 [Myxococcus xanthus DZ2]QZZ49595.1 hypothetical protein MyxoNM_10300 [Myxococcus xanthus]